MPVRAGDAEIVAALRRALVSYGIDYAQEASDGLLATVRRIAEQRAAEELRETAVDYARFRRASFMGDEIAEELQHRVAALTATPTHGKDAT